MNTGTRIQRMNLKVVAVSLSLKPLKHQTTHLGAEINEQ